MRKLKQKYVNNAGFALVGVLLVIVLVAGIGMTLIPLASNSMKMSSIDQQEKSAFYIAEAGMTVKMAEIKEQIADVYEETTDERAFYQQLVVKINEMDLLYDEFEPVKGEQPTAELSLEWLEEEKGTYKITSTGKIGNQKRTVEQNFKVEWLSKPGEPFDLPNLAIFTEGDIIINNNNNKSDGKKVEGSIGSKGYLDIDSDYVNGTIHENVKDNFPDYYELPPIPTNYYKLVEGKLKKTTENTNYPNLEEKHKNIYIETDGKNIIMVVNNLSLHHANLIITGKGKLTLYVVGDFSVQHSEINKNEVPLDLYVYQDNIDLKNETVFNGNLLTDANEITMNPAKQNHNSLIFAPNAHFVQTGGHLHGMVVAKSLKLAGNGSISYGGPFLVESPDYGPGNSETNAGPIFIKTPVRETDNH